jgi:hypothetical protein
MKSFRLFAATFAFVTSFASVARGSDCRAEGRNTVLCNQMKALRAHLMMLDENRELVRANFPMLKANGESMYQLTVKILTSRNNTEHLSDLGAVKSLAANLRDQASKSDPAAFVTANRIKGKCQACHSLSQSETGSGFSWNEIYAKSWDEIAQHCNQEERNPYICKSMYGMTSMFGYFEPAMRANHLSFELADEAASEVRRIALELKTIGSLGESHSLDALQEVVVWSESLSTLAKRRDPYVYQRALEVQKACGQCHAAPL